MHSDECLSSLNGFACTEQDTSIDSVKKTFTFISRTEYEHISVISVVRTVFSAGDFSLSCARLLAGWVTALWLSRNLPVRQHG